MQTLIQNLVASFVLSPLLVLTGCPQKPLVVRDYCEQACIVRASKSQDSALTKRMSAIQIERTKKLCPLVVVPDCAVIKPAFGP